MQSDFGFELAVTWWFPADAGVHEVKPGCASKILTAEKAPLLLPSIERQKSDQNAQIIFYGNKS
ncbi:MAG: hypothetical protein AAGH89_09515 [Verrucomicrobiota bacterium]